MELKAFARGGRPGLEALSRVYVSIMKYHNIPVARHEHLLEDAGLRLQFGKIRILRPKTAPKFTLSSKKFKRGKKRRC